MSTKEEKAISIEKDNVVLDHAITGPVDKILCSKYEDILLYTSPEDAKKLAKVLSIKEMESNIDENSSILEMAKAHMDQRAQLVIKDRIDSLTRQIAYLRSV